MKKKMLIVGITVIVLTICFSGCVEHINRNGSINENPCPDSDPSGGGVSPIRPSNYLEFSVNGFFDFTEAVSLYGEVSGSWQVRSSDVNITIENNHSKIRLITITARNVLNRKCGSFQNSHKCEMWITDYNKVTYLFYSYIPWQDCCEYEFRDQEFIFDPFENKTINLRIQLDEMPEESIVDNKIFLPSDYCTPYSIYVFDEEAWTRIDFEVRT